MRSVVVVVMVVVLLLPFPAAAQAPTDEAVEALVARLDEDPDPLHADYTPSVHALCAIGLRGARAVLDRLDAPHEMARLRAERVLACAVSRFFGFVPGRGFADDPAGEERARALWRENGSYDFRAPRAERLASIARWRRWLDRNATRPPPVPDELGARALREGLVAVEPRLRACLPAGISAVVVITLEGRGRVTRVRLPADLEGTAEGRCLRAAASAIRVSPFRRRTRTVSVRVQGSGSPAPAR